MPELTQFIQPLSGEYAGYRDLFANIPYPVGYGVETGMILDIYRKWGLNVMAQVDLDRRIHRHQDTRALGQMAFTIMRTLLNRLETYGQIQFDRPIYKEMIQYDSVKHNLCADSKMFQDSDRPPMMGIEEYRERFELNPP
jgi:glucosyl-3-phosphoglycerate synthase